MRTHGLTLRLALVTGIAALKHNLAPQVTLPQAHILGTRDDHGNSVFLGIPYAATTGGSNRWKPPQELAPSTFILNATQYGPTCPQAITNAYYTRQDEDCLSVNIWAPANATKRPVFVYMYGGAMVTGSSSNPQLQGNNFARKGVVYVSLNTRESIWASPNSVELTGKNDSQNFSVLDVEKALEWIHDHIAAFGGDPNHIVFGGHSSGSVQVDHYLWNHPDTWLAGAVQMSATALSGPAYAPTNVALDVVASEVGCATGGEGGQLECLRNVSIYDIQTSSFNATTNTWFTPVIDNITRHSDYAARLKQGHYASHVPLLTGNSDGEGTIFSLVYSSENTNFSSWINTFDADSSHIPDSVLLSAYGPFLTNNNTSSSASSVSGLQYGEARFDCPVDYLLDLRSAHQQTWTYRFFGAYDNVVGVPGTAPTHGTEVPFFLGGNECFDTLSNVTREQQELADAIHDWFVHWIKDPAAGPGWERVQFGDGDDGVVAMVGLSGERELERVEGRRGDFNQRCQEVYKQYFPDYPVLVNPTL